MKDDAAKLVTDVDLAEMARLLTESMTMSPRPWRIIGPGLVDNRNSDVIRDAQTEPVADCYGEGDAALIVAAINALPGLLRRLAAAEAVAAASLAYQRARWRFDDASDDIESDVEDRLAETQAAWAEVETTNNALVAARAAHDALITRPTSDGGTRG